MNAAIRTSVVALAVLAAVGSAQANGRHHGHRFHGHYYGHGYGPLWGVLGFGIGLGVARAYYYDQGPYPDIVYVPAPPAVAYGEPRHESRAPMRKAPPDPIIYPRDGQSAAQTEIDRRDCNRWAMTQPSAMADASVFHRATIACMEGRGYTLR